MKTANENTAALYTTIRAAIAAEGLVLADLEALGMTEAAGASRAVLRDLRSRIMGYTLP